MTVGRPTAEGAIEVTLRGIAGGIQGEVRLSAAATACLAQSPGLRAFVARVQALALPSPEFCALVGVKLERGYARRGGVVSVEPRLLGDGKAVEKTADILAENPRALAQVSVSLVAYELLLEWRGVHGGPIITVPCSLSAELMGGHTAEALWRSKVRWLMAELVLARYGLDAYREDPGRRLPLR